MAIKFVPCGAAILTVPLISGCVKQHAKWYEVTLSLALWLPYVSAAPCSETSPAHQFIPRPPINSQQTSGTVSATSESSTSYSGSSGRGPSSGGGGYSSGGDLTRSEKRWLAIAVMQFFFRAPFAWLFYPSRRRSRSQERTTPLIPALQVPSRETWDAEGLCPNSGGSMFQRVARRGHNWSRYSI
jgi:hypothetical protein